mgnify:FL=1
MVSILPEPSFRGVFYWLGTGMVMLSTFTLTTLFISDEIVEMLRKKE